MRRSRVGAAFLAAALAGGLAGPASARTSPPAKYGGTLVVGLSGGDPDSLDPTVSTSAQSTLIYGATCQTLYDYDAKLQLHPVLAAALPVLSKDKLSYTVQLRQGVRFNDGTPFNAQAVVATIQRYITFPGSLRASDYASLDSVTASGPFTVVYHLKARDSTFVGNPRVLSPTQLTSLGDSFGTHPVCVGPFMFDHRVVGDNVTYVKSPYYYDQKDVFLDKIVYKPMSNTAAAAASLKAGDIQVLDDVSTTELAGVQQTPGLRVIRASNLGWNGMGINIGNRGGLGSLPYQNVGTPLASSPKLRQAFEEAIDRNTMNKVVFGGLDQPSCTMVSATNAAWYAATRVPCTPYDLNDAKKLVSQSGFSNPTVHLLVRTRTDELRLAQFVQAQEAAIGINVVIDLVDPTTFTSRRTSGNFDTTLLNSLGNPDPGASIYPTVASVGSRNFAGYSNPRLDLILSNGLKATGVPARSTLYHVAQQIVTADRPIIVLYNAAMFTAFSAALTGVERSAVGTLHVENARYK